MREKIAKLSQEAGMSQASKTLYIDLQKWNRVHLKYIRETVTHRQEKLVT